MQGKRRAHLPRYTQMAREQIIRIWDELMVGPNERAKFREMYEGKCQVPSSASVAMETVTGDEIHR
jgi:hypothetical protein